MKKFLVAAMAVFAVTLLFDNSSAQAQGYSSGLGFNRGAIQTQGHFGFSARRGQSFGYGGHFGRGLGFNNRGLGIGLGYGNGNFISAFSNTQRPENQPFFAMNPPVYYNGIVRRPYGISPFPAPAGVIPAEMQVPKAQPITINNPFFNEAVPASDVKVTPADATDNKTTMTTIQNPYFVPVAEDQVEFACLQLIVDEN